MWTKIDEQNRFPENVEQINYFKCLISKIFKLDINSLQFNITNIQRFEDVGEWKYSKNKIFLIEFTLKRSDGTPEFKKIIAKKPSSDSNLNSILRINEKDFSKRIKTMRIPKILGFDRKSGYVFKEFVQGTNVDHILNRIINGKKLKDREKQIFEKMGRSLAELHFKLDMVHGDTKIANWIYEEKLKLLFLIDWDHSRRGDYSYDLTDLLYSIARTFSNYIKNTDLETQDQILDIFDDIYLAITNGYTNTTADQRVTKKATDYWIHYILSVEPKVQERTFHNSGVHTPRLFRILTTLLAPFMSTKTTNNRHISRHMFLKICIVILLILKKRNLSLAYTRLRKPR